MALPPAKEQIKGKLRKLIPPLLNSYPIFVFHFLNKNGFHATPEGNDCGLHSFVTEK
jgi:hypothetical protein